MTREDAINYGKEQLEIFGGTHREFIEMSIKALEQEPFKPMVEIDLYSVIKQKYIERDVLDKISAEIEQLPTTECTETHIIYIDADDFKENVLAILDKYKAEIERAQA